MTPQHQVEHHKDPASETPTTTANEHTVHAQGEVSVELDDFGNVDDISHPWLNPFVIVFGGLAIWLLIIADTQITWVNNQRFIEQPGFWSLVSLGGIAIFAVLHLLTRLVRNKLFVKQSSIPSKNFAPYRVKWYRIVLPFEFAAYFLLYVWLVPRLGYLPTTIIAMPLLTLRCGYRDKKWLIAAVCIGIGIVLLFKTFLQVKIPGGELYHLFPDAIRNFFIINF